MLFGFAIFGFALFDFALFGFAHFGFALFGFALFAQGHRLSQCSLSLQIQTITVKNQEFGLSREEPTQPFYYAQFDGIMGMAYPALAAGGTPTPLQGMLEQNQLKQPIFSFYFSR